MKHIYTSFVDKYEETIDVRYPECDSCRQGVNSKLQTCHYERQKVQLNLKKTPENMSSIIGFEEIYPRFSKNKYLPTRLRH